MFDTTRIYKKTSYNKNRDIWQKQIYGSVANSSDFRRQKKPKRCAFLDQKSH